MIHMPLKWHHINKCNKNCKKVDVLTSILACLSSFAPQHLFDISRQLQNDYIVWFLKVRFVKVIQRSLKVLQQPFNISTPCQNDHILWFKNMNIIKVLQGSLIVSNNILTFPQLVKIKTLFGSRPLTLSKSCKAP